MSDSARKPTSRMLRTTDEDRPFTRDFKDLFSTLMVSLELGPRRVRFSKIDFTFTVEEALNNLSSLRFTQSARMPDPQDPSRIITTTSTTTFTMAKEMAKSIFKDFIHARFLEPLNATFTSLSKSTVCTLTAKGIAVLHRFCNRNGIAAPHVMRVLQSPRNKMTLLILERHLTTDKLLVDRATIEVIFRRFAGAQAPGASNGLPAWDDRTDYPNGLVGVEGIQDMRVSGKKYQYAFSGKSAINWLMDCCTTIDERETYQVCEQFIEHGLIVSIVEDKSYIEENGASALSFQPTRQAIYTLTPRAMKVCGWAVSDRLSDESINRKRESKANDGSSVSSNSATGPTASGDVSNKARLTYILNDPSLRLLFREFLAASFCEENLAFYLDVTEYLDNYKQSKTSGELKDYHKVQDYIAGAFGLYNSFLAPGSPCELNIDHALRNRLSAEMTRLCGDEQTVARNLEEVVNHCQLAQTSIFKLMASDSVPKFCRQPRYAVILQEHDFESVAGNPSRPASPVSTPMKSADR
ncbi:developmental regulator flbA, putative [Talaromyces stipitatus ATCC 10500]|uniref:Developmental regulator flbA, putative n=1 Tax=Talaromyces stipitatus (strain ATCC 10500 / CBS 375.48 / QM 6759 / NRRL 1006) TaxID=441959 RepID=B8LWX1_TALSN|nr:developmental regulator flbA, putative [Talaromyces stipitatus ATCC 10500]EED24604.1 developmental regulator flbA, putative [Talaromyces stipitatus ATCC 10500]